MTVAIASSLVGMVLGVVIGSYLTCISWRIPRRIPITGRSICPHCKQELKNQWNIPVLGWLLLRGRSGCCGQPISIRYPLIELFSAVIGAVIGWQLGMIWLWAVVLAVIVLSSVISFATADASKKII